MNTPTVQPFDVFTPLQAAGQATAGAVKDIGSTIDTYNTMNVALQDRNKRREIRGMLIKEAGLDDTALPPDMQADELAKLANKIKAAKDVVSEVVENGGPKAIPSTSEKRLIALAAGATDDAFWRAIGATQDAVTAYKKEKEGSVEGQRLQDVSSGLGPVHEIPSLSSGVPKTTTLGSAEEPLPPPSIADAAASQRMADMQAGAQAKPAATVSSTGEVTREGALKAAVGAGVDVTKAGKERMSAFEGQFQPTKDIASEQNKESNLRIARDRLAQAGKKLAQDATFKEFAIGFGTLVKNNQLQDARQKMLVEARKLRSDAEVLSSKGYEGGDEKIKAAEALESAFQFSEGNSQVLQDISSDMMGYLGKKYPQFEERDAGIRKTLIAADPSFSKLSAKEQRAKIDEYKRNGKSITVPGGVGMPAPKTQADYDALPAGAIYVDGDGVKKRKK